MELEGVGVRGGVQCLVPLPAVPHHQCESSFDYPSGNFTHYESSDWGAVFYLAVSVCHIFHGTYLAYLANHMEMKI